MNHEPTDVVESRLASKALFGKVSLAQLPHRPQAWKQTPVRGLEHRVRKFDLWQEELGFTDNVRDNRRKFNNISHRNKVAYKRDYRVMEIANFTEGNRDQMIVESMFHLRSKAVVL